MSITKQFRTPVELSSESAPTRSRGKRTAIAALIAIATAVGLCGAGSAGAATLASGTIRSDNAESLICTLLNVGSTPVKVLSSKMTDGYGGNLLGYNGCFKATLQPLHQCGFVVYAAQGAGLFEIDASKGHVRGTCQLYVDGVAVATTEMR